MMILAARSGSTCNCSISVSSATTFCGYFFGSVSCTVDGSSGSAIGAPMKSLTAPAMRLAVVKSALRSASRTWPRWLSANSISRSMMAPLAMRPTVGTPCVILAASPCDLEAADRQRALRHRIDVAVGAEQRRHQQRAALQALGVAHGRGGDVDAGALGAERRQVRRHHHGRDVAGADLRAADVDAEPFQHRLQRLLGERDVVERVAGAVEADDEAIADQLVLAHALDVGEILDARRRPCRGYGVSERNIMDFNGLILDTCRLAHQVPGVAGRIRQSYPYWLIDEFQDTSPAQYRLVRFLAGDAFKNVFSVADDDQIIYQWAGASYRQIVAFREHFSPSLIQLVENRRCPAVVVEAANSLVAHNLERSPGKQPAVAAQVGEGSISQRVFLSDEDEATGIAAEIAAAAPETWGRTAVLARTRANLQRYWTPYATLAFLPGSPPAATGLFHRNSYGFKHASIRCSAQRIDKFSLPWSTRQTESLVANWRPLC